MFPSKSRLSLHCQPSLAGPITGHRVWDISPQDPTLHLVGKSLQWLIGPLFLFSQGLFMKHWRSLLKLRPVCLQFNLALILWFHCFTVALWPNCVLFVANWFKKEIVNHFCYICFSWLLINVFVEAASKKLECQKLRNCSGRGVFGTERQSSTCRMKRWCPAKMVPSVCRWKRKNGRRRKRKGLFFVAGRGSLPNRLISISPPCLRSSRPLFPSLRCLELREGEIEDLHSVINIKRLACPALWPCPFCHGVGGSGPCYIPMLAKRAMGKRDAEKRKTGRDIKVSTGSPQSGVWMPPHGREVDLIDPSQGKKMRRSQILFYLFLNKICKNDKVALSPSLWQDSRLFVHMCGWVGTLGSSLWTSQPCLLFLWSGGYNMRGTREGRWKEGLGPRIRASGNSPLVSNQAWQTRTHTHMAARMSLQALPGVKEPPHTHTHTALAGHCY